MDVTLPTIGRVVYLFDTAAPEKPFVGFVSDVGIGGNLLTINCAALVSSGAFILDGLQGVPHKSEPLDSRVYWDWMPYQKGQAAKTEALEAQTKRQE